MHVWINLVQHLPGYIAFLSTLSVSLIRVKEVRILTIFVVAKVSDFTPRYKKSCYTFKFYFLKDRSLMLNGLFSVVSSNMNSIILGF